MLRALSLLVLFSAIGPLGCVYQHLSIAQANYGDRNLFSDPDAGNNRYKYKEIGPVEASASGKLAVSCEELVDRAASNLNQSAVELGGNGVIGVRWESETGMGLDPTCKKKTGWFVRTPRPPWLRTGLCCVGPCETSLYGVVGPNLSAQALGVRVFNWAGLASGSRLKMSRR